MKRALGSRLNFDTRYCKTVPITGARMRCALSLLLIVLVAFAFASAATGG